MKWETARISEFCKTGTGGTPSRSKLERYYEGGTVPWVKSGELRENIITETSEHITDAALRETNVKLVPSGALLLALYGATVGRLGVLGFDATTNQAVCHIIPDPKKANTRYLFHALSNQVPHLVARGVGGAQPNISQGIVKGLAIPLPPLPEQKRIATILDAADALRAKRRESLAELDALLQSTFLTLFGDPVENPMGWEVAPLRSVAELENGDRSSNYPSGPDIMESGVLFLNTKNIYGSRLVLDNCQFISEEKFRSLSRGKLRRKDVVITLRGTLANCAIFDCEFDTGFINAQLLIIRPGDRVVHTYLHAFLVTERMRRHFEGLSTGVAVRQLTGKQIGQLSIPVPPLDRQRRFAAIAESIEQQKSRQRTHLAEIDALFASLQHRAFNGQLTAA